MRPTKTMALIGANELKRKLLIAVDGQPYVVLEAFFASPTARGAATMVRTKLRHLLTGAVMEKSFRSSEKFDEPDVELVPASYLYSDADGCHFMDEKSYEQFAFSPEEIGTDRNYLRSRGTRSAFHQGRGNRSRQHSNRRSGWQKLPPLDAPPWSAGPRHRFGLASPFQLLVG